MVVANDSLIPSVRLDATLTGRQHCYDAWRETVRPFYDVEPLSDVVEGRESVKAWLVNNLIFTDVAFSRQSFSHHASHAENAGYLSLQVYRRGECRGVAAGQPFRMRPGEIYLFDFSREHHSVADESAVAGVVIPHDVIGYDPARHPGQMRLSYATAAGGILIDAFLSLLGQLPELRMHEASGFADGFCDLLRRHAFPGPSDEPRIRRRRAERRMEMLSYVEQHLDNPDLSVEQLCRAFGASVPSVYREFADTGGVARYIAKRRLDRAFRQLLSAAPRRGQVQEIASRCGFDDPAYFSRLFHKHFGVSPSAMLGLGQARDMPFARQLPSRAAADGEARIGDWLSLI